MPRRCLTSAWCAAGAKPLPLPLTITLDSDMEGTPAAAGRAPGRTAAARGTPASAINLLSDSDGEGKPSSRKKAAGGALAMLLTRGLRLVSALALQAMSQQPAPSYVYLEKHLL